MSLIDLYLQYSYTYTYVFCILYYSRKFRTEVNTALEYRKHGAYTKCVYYTICTSSLWLPWLQHVNKPLSNQPHGKTILLKVNGTLTNVIELYNITTPDILYIILLIN